MKAFLATIFALASLAAADNSKCVNESAMSQISNKWGDIAASIDDMLPMLKGAMPDKYDQATKVLGGDKVPEQFNSDLVNQVLPMVPDSMVGKFLGGFGIQGEIYGSCTPSGNKGESSAAPESSSAAPESSSAAPESSSAAPESSSAAPESSSAAPESSSAAPESSSATSASATSAPESSAAPESSSAAPETSAAKPSGDKCVNESVMSQISNKWGDIAASIDDMLPMLKGAMPDKYEQATKVLGGTKVPEQFNSDLVNQVLPMVPDSMVGKFLGGFGIKGDVYGACTPSGNSSESSAAPTESATSASATSASATSAPATSAPATPTSAPTSGAGNQPTVTVTLPYNPALTQYPKCQN